MSIATMILGQSGTGKSASLRNMDPAQTLLIQTIPKPLPFRSSGWKLVKDGGNVIVSALADTIINAMHKTSRPIVVIDDFQYLLAVEFMARASETGYGKFTEMAKHYFDVLTAAANLAPEKRVYLLSHTDMAENGQVKAKTIGKLLDEKITVEGLVTIVLRTHVINGQYVFSTHNSGQDTVKTPMGMFETEHIPNDLLEVDKAVVEYYSLSSKAD
ncbi:MAG: ATP-binding protein [Gammaproteobacteria bacterium]|nr:ATP-binding protein [Gammaproteobacteria bacterium]